MLQVLKVFVVNSNCTTSEKNTVMYVPALPSAGRQTASALQGGRGEPQGTGAGPSTLLGLRREAEPQQPGSLL